MSAPGTGTPAADPATDGGVGTVVWAAEASPVHGGQVWAVYLAVGSPDSDWDRHMLGEAEGYLIGRGYSGSGIGEVGCDQGAAEQLGFDPDDHRGWPCTSTAPRGRRSSWASTTGRTWGRRG